MEKDAKICNSELLERYLDQELGPEDASVVEQHVKKCPSCQHALRAHQIVSGLFKAKMNDMLAQTSLQSIETTVVAAIDRHRASWWTTLLNLFVSKRFYVPATAAVAGLVLLGIFLTPSPPVATPSAIVSSFKGDVGSVMFLETPTSHQTVIWFNEPVSSNGPNGTQGSDGSAILDFPTQRFHIV